jgi:hypothetical protein
MFCFSFAEAEWLVSCVRQPRSQWRCTRPCPLTLSDMKQGFWLESSAQGGHGSSYTYNCRGQIIQAERSWSLTHTAMPCPGLSKDRVVDVRFVDCEKLAAHCVHARRLRGKVGSAHWVCGAAVSRSLHLACLAKTRSSFCYRKTEPTFRKTLEFSCRGLKNATAFWSQKRYRKVGNILILGGVSSACTAERSAQVAFLFRADVFGSGTACTHVFLSRVSEAAGSCKDVRGGGSTPHFAKSWLGACLWQGPCAGALCAQTMVRHGNRCTQQGVLQRPGNLLFALAALALGALGPVRATSAAAPGVRRLSARATPFPCLPRRRRAHQRQSCLAALPLCAHSGGHVGPQCKHEQRPQVLLFAPARPFIIGRPACRAH